MTSNGTATDKATLEAQMNAKRLQNGQSKNCTPDREICNEATAPVSTHVTLPPDGGWGWVVVAASFFCNLIVDGIIYSFTFFMNDIGTAFGESNTKVSLVGSLLSGTYLIAGPFASALANRYGFRAVSILGSILGTIAFLLSSVAPSIGFLCFSYGIIGGIGFGFIFVPAMIIPGFYFEKWRALATGIAVCGSGVGVFVMAPISEFLIQQLTWRGAFIVQAGFVLNCAVFGLLFRPLKQVSVNVPLIVDEEDQLDRRKSMLLLKTRVFGDAKNKSESMLNIYQDLGVTVEDTNETRVSLFKSNSKYPTASQILYFEKSANIPEEDKSYECSNSSQSLNIPKKSVVTLQTDKFDMTGNTSKRNSIIPEMRILIQQRHGSWHSAYKSKSFSETNRKNSLKFGRRNTTEFGNRPLYRDDIFFSSNLSRLSKYTSQNSSIDYAMSVTRLPTYTDILEEEKSTCSLCPEAFRRALATMLDVSLFKSVTFLMLAVSGIFTAMGMYVPYVYIIPRATSFGVDKTTSLWLISVIGIANTVGRVGLGILSSIPNTNAVVLNNISLTICGLSIIFGAVSTSVTYQFGFASIFGASIACFSSLRTIIVVDLLGLENLTNAFGLLLLFQGVAAIIGPPLAGYFVDTLGSFSISFYIAGILIVISAVICYPIEMINKWEKKKIAQNLKTNNISI